MDWKKWVMPRNKISGDELQAREETKQKLKDDPVRKAAVILEEAAEKVLAGLGVKLDGDIKEQQQNLGIGIIDICENGMGELQGFYFIVGTPNPYGPVPIPPHTPVAFIGDAYLDNMGYAWCRIHYFGKNERVEEFGGAKIMQ